MKYNKNQLVMQAVNGRIHAPTTSGARVGYDGQGVLLPGVGGITYNFQIGDNCVHLIGDHVEPGLSLAARDPKENLAFNMLSCIGNEATIVSGAASGKKGVVTGIHGGVNHVMVYVDEETLNLVNNDDQLRIKAYGQGLSLDAYPDITLMNIDPSLLEKMEGTHLFFKDGSLLFKVAKIIPAHYMGAGIGEQTLRYGDYDIMIQNDKVLNELQDLRFGDFVAIENHDTRFGAYYNEDYISIGVICHSNSFSAGHGPGVTVIASAKKSHLKVQLDTTSNLSYYFRQ